MGSEAINAPLKEGKKVSEWVWYSSNAALNEGEAVCYNYDYGTASDADASRLNRVETPSTTNAQWFAGVAARAYTAVSTGQFIEIYKPGSVCNIWSGASTTVGVGLLTFDVTSSFEGFFRHEGLPGKGSARPLQTVDRSSTAGLCMAELLDGPQSGGVEVVQLAAGAVTCMVGGSSLVVGASLGSNATFTLADGTIAGLRKKFKCITTEITTNDFVITVTSGATDDVDDVSLDTVTFAGASTCLNKSVTLTWDGAWMVNGRTEDVPALAGS